MPKPTDPDDWFVPVTPADLEEAEGDEYVAWHIAGRRADAELAELVFERVYETRKEQVAYAWGWWSWQTQDPRGMGQCHSRAEWAAFSDGEFDCCLWDG